MASHPLQVLAQCMMLATWLSHKPCTLKAMHLLGDSLSLAPMHESGSLGLIINAETVDENVALMVASHPLHVLSHPPEASVPHKSYANIAWH